MSQLKTIQVLVSAALILVAFILVAAYLFPSARGSNWKETDLLLAAVIALLAIAIRLL